MAENAAIWQVQSGAVNGTQTTATSTNTVLFNESPITVDGSFIFQTDIDFRRAVPENEGVNVDNNELQDMGIEGLDIQITGRIRNADNDVSTNSINKLIKWLKNGNTTTGYTKGRYGLKLDDLPQFNVDPTSTYGYHIRSVRFVRDGENKDQVGIILSLALGGDLASAI